MLDFYLVHQKKILKTSQKPEILQDLTWIDLFSPTQEEEALLEELLKIDIPTREDMRAIETSNRLYTENHTIFMTANLLSDSDKNTAQTAPVTFILMPGKLITVRYTTPSAFGLFPERSERAGINHDCAESLLLVLLETIVDRLSDPLEIMAGKIDTLTNEVLKNSDTNPKADFNAILQSIGRKADLNSKVKESLVSIERLVAYLGANMHSAPPSQKDIHFRLKILEQDIKSLSEHAAFLSNKINFLLQAALGMIGIEQNTIIKFFSVAAVIFLPPTLIASVYGMNFEHMPELDWAFGYPATLAAMFLSAVLPYGFFRYKGWL